MEAVIACLLLTSSRNGEASPPFNHFEALVLSLANRIRNKPGIFVAAEEIDDSFMSMSVKMLSHFTTVKFFSERRSLMQAVRQNSKATVIGTRSLQNIVNVSDIESNWLATWYLPEDSFGGIQPRLDSKVFFYSWKEDGGMMEITERYSVKG